MAHLAHVCGTLFQTYFDPVRRLSAAGGLAATDWGYFGGAITLFAFLGKGLRGGLVWREPSAAFGWFQLLPAVAKAALLMWLVPLLALPQSTHYVLDSFIWRQLVR